MPAYQARSVFKDVAPPPGPPSWLSGAAVGQWATISGTAAPKELEDYCGMAVRGWDEASGEVWCYSAASGGHGGNLTNNRVMGLRLDVNSPAWTTLRAADSSAGWDTTGSTSAYFTGGQPAPRHNYVDTWYVPEHGRVVVGGRYWGSNAWDWLVQDGFVLSSNTWDAAATYPNRPNSGPYLDARDPSTGIWYGAFGHKWTPGASPAASSYSTFTLSGSPTVGILGNAFDTTRGRLYHLSAGNNFSGGTAINSCRISISTGVKTAIGFNSSSAWTQFQSDAAAGFFLTSTLVYDQDADCFYFYNGGSEGTTKVYKVTPNGTDTWDMSLLSVTGGTPGLSLGGSPARGGVLTKFRYISRWRCIVLVVPEQNVWFLRTA